jgi:hypothetical protein
MSKVVVTRRSLIVLAVLAVLAGVVVTALIGATGLRAWQSHNDHQRFVAQTEPYMPLAAALAALPPPTGMKPNPINNNPRVAVVVGFQWEGRFRNAEAAAEAFQRALLAVGSTDPVGRCSSGHAATLCRVDSALAGRPFTVFISEIGNGPTRATVTPEFYLPATGKWLQATPF